jgi:hypothetical protein
MDIYSMCYLNQCFPRIWEYHRTVTRLPRKWVWTSYSALNYCNNGGYSIGGIGGIRAQIVPKVVMYRSQSCPVLNAMYLVMPV